MTFRGFALGLALLVPSVAMAGPISVDGVWAPTASQSSDPLSQSLELEPFWGGVSWDGPLKGIGYLIKNEYGTMEGVEYLRSSSGGYASFLFDFNEPLLNLTKFNGITAWTGGTFGRRADGAFTYDSGTGRVSNSIDSGEQYALFRVVLPEVTRYFLGIEDILLSEVLNDRDYNDYVVRFDVATPVPEPTTLLLFGTGMAALAARKKVAARKARVQATV